MANNRIAYLDSVKLFTIYLVILGHVIGMMVNGYAVGEKLISLIYSFHMPLFVLLSGYFISNNYLQKPLINAITTKAKQLLLPTITCTVICLLYLFLTRGHVDVRAEVIGNSWFLKTLFVYYVLFYLIKKIPMNDWLLLVISCTLLFLIPKGSTMQINQLFPYFWGGYLIRKYNLLSKVSLSWGYAAFFLLLFIGTYLILRNMRISNSIAINADNLQNLWHLILFRYVVAFSGCMATITTISMLFKYIGIKSFMTKIAKYGQWTLGIYVLQTILIINIFPDTLAWYVESEWLLDYVVAPLLSLAFLVLCLYLIHLISKNKTLDLLFFGGQYNKK